ncbi:MAG: ATP-binding protein, partial [Candidatus Izemoplasmatales bacterium]|nr:ATP-binding protein [Candidatus Izemoplasmatales bacterium]
DSNDNKESLEKIYRNYLRWGGLPYIINLNNNETIIKDYLEGIYNTVFIKDIISKNKISDIFVLEDIIRFVFDNIGNITSSKKIADTLSSNGRKTSRPTVDLYLSYLLNSYVVDKVNRYDIKGKEYLKTLEKYYVIDLGIRNYLLGYKVIDRGHILENVVYLELKRRGYDIYIGKYEDKEIDFVARKNNYVYYLQVTETIKSKETLIRELAPLEAINDFYPRVLITQDYETFKTYDGIKIINLFEWLLNEVDFI